MTHLVVSHDEDGVFRRVRICVLGSDEAAGFARVSGLVLA